MCIALAPQGAWLDEEAGIASPVKCPSGPLVSRRNEDRDSYPSYDTCYFALKGLAGCTGRARWSEAARETCGFVLSRGV